MLEIGSVLEGKYKILKQIGAGGISRVYLATNEKTSKQVAIKEIVFNDSTNFEGVLKNHVDEIEKIIRLNHTAIPKIYDVIKNKNALIIVIDYTVGETLSRLLDEYGAQPEETVIDWGKQICDALDYLHSQNPPLLYRDVKPGEIMLKPDGKIVLISFGQVREYNKQNLADTTVFGTLGYAAPEGYMGQNDPRSDIYGLGATLYHLVTGVSPAEPPYDIRPIRQWNPELSEGLEWIIDKCCQPMREKRFQSCKDVLWFLDHIQEITPTGSGIFASIRTKRTRKQREAMFIRMQKRTKNE